MKRKILSLASLCLLTVVSCTQEETIEENRITRMSAELPEFLDEDGTRSQINVSATDAITYTWAIGDVLGIFPDEGNQVYFSLTESSLSADGKSATFDGRAWALKNGHTYYSYFPFSYENFSESSNPTAIPMDYTGQSITEWGDTKNAGHYDFLAAGGTTPNGGALSFKFQRLSALLRLKLTLPATGTYQKLTLSTDTNVIPVKGKVNLSASTLAYIPQTYASEISLNLNNISGTEGQVVYVYMMLPPMALLSHGRSLIISLLCSSGEWKYDIYKTGDATSITPDFKANTIYKREAVPQGIGILNGHEFIDLGLPSGTLWATCNVGADNPEDYGNYYAWGETKAYGEEDWSNLHNYNYSNTYTKTNYQYGTYKYCSGTDNNTLTKYNTDGNFGNVDNKRELELSDDAAYVNWGSGWRMPSKTQFEELINNSYTIVSWATIAGVSGYKITSKMPGCTDRFIFLPAAGSHNATTLDFDGADGYYWSRSLSDEYYTYSSCALYFYYDFDFRISNCDRYCGRSVRAVCSK